MSLSYETGPGDVDHLIADDHAVVERQFQHLEAGRGDRRVLANQVVFELSLHADAEERIVYPAMAEAGEDPQHRIDVHQGMKELLVILNDNEPGDPEFEDALARLIAEVRHHVAEEEGTFLPRFRQLVGPVKMRQLGRQFLAAKRSAPTYAHPNAPSGKLGHLIADPLAALTDRIRDRLSGRQIMLATDPSGVLDPQAQRILDTFSALVPLPFETLEPDQARKQPTPVDAVRRILSEDGRFTGPEPVGDVRNITIPGPDGHDLPIRIYHPTGSMSGEPLPVILWVHGGGWVLFTVDTYDASCRGLVNKTGAIVVSPEYRRAPEHVFPAAHDDVLATYRWIGECAAEFGGDASRIAIGGESVGGNMAAATSWQLARAGARVPVAQVLVYPLTTGEQFGESMDDAADARPLNRPLLSWMAMHAFEGVPEGVKDLRVDLLSIPAVQLAGLPPTLVITDERDILRSQGEEFARHLDEAGVPTTLSRYDGVMHEFFGAAAVLDKAELAQQEAASHLRRMFGTLSTVGAST